MRERGFGWDAEDPIRNDIRLGVDAAKVVSIIVSEKDYGLKVSQGTSRPFQ